MKRTNELKRLEILVGDDGFLDPVTKMIFRDDYVPKLIEKISQYELNIVYETDPKKVVENASKYDVVVTDLDYTGDSTGKQGYDVVDAVAQLNPTPLLILCTSSDNFTEIHKRTAGKINYHAGTGNGHKFDDLVNVLISHYTQQIL